MKISYYLIFAYCDVKIGQTVFIDTWFRLVAYLIQFKKNCEKIFGLKKNSSSLKCQELFHPYDTIIINTIHHDICVDRPTFIVRIHHI